MTRKQRRAWGHSSPKILTGVPLLDRLLDGGPASGSLTYLVGTPGSGRAWLASRFLLSGARALWLDIDGLEPALPEGILREVHAREAIDTLRVNAVSSAQPDNLQALHDDLVGFQPDRVVVWGADILELSNPGVLTGLLTQLSAHAATTLLVGTSGSFGGEFQVSTPRLLSFAQNVLHCQSRIESEDSAHVARALKTTPAQAHSPVVRYRYDGTTISIVEDPVAAAPPVNGSTKKRFLVVPEVFYYNPHHQELVSAHLENVNKKSAHSTFAMNVPTLANIGQYNAQMEEVRAGRLDLDMFIVDICRLREMIDLGIIQPLDEFLPHGWENRYLKVAVDQCKVNGRVWALPHWMNIGILVYRQDLLAKYHLPPPGTWPELVDSAARVIKGEKHERISGFGFQGAQVEALTCNFLEFLWGNGGSVYDSSLHVNLASVEAVGALQFMCDLIYKHKVAPSQTPTLTEAHSQRLFLEHKLLFTRTWPKFLKELPKTFTDPDEQVSFAPLPTLNSRVPNRGVIGGFCYVIGRQVKDPELLIEFYSSFYTPDMVKRLSREGSMCSPFRSVYEDPSVMAGYPRLTGIPELLETGLSRGAIPHYSKLTEVVQREVNAALRQVKSPKKALTAAAEDLHKHIFRHHREQRLVHAIEYVDKTLHEEISRDKAAQVCHLAPSYFSALFADVFGCSFTRYVSDKRVEKAKDLLERSGLTIAEVGQKVGFKDQSYFCQVFRQSTNMTPSEYRLNAMTNVSHH